MNEMITVYYSPKQQYTCGSFIFLCFNINLLISQIPPPRIASNFRHLLSCDTIEIDDPRECFISSRTLKLFQDSL